MKIEGKDNKTVRWLVPADKERAGILVYDITSSNQVRLSRKGKEYRVDIEYVIPTNPNKYNQRVWTCPYIVVEDDVYILNEFKDVKRDILTGEQKVLDSDEDFYIRRT